MRHDRLATLTLPLIAALLVSTSARSVLAQDSQPILLDEIVITANRADRPVSAIPGSVQVIEGDELRTAQAGATGATDLLARVVPGFSFSNQTLSGASETFRGRGLLVMVDGVPRNTPLRDASRILSTIDLNNVERVEVIGGASSLYGAGGTGGMVNFITKSGALADGKARITTEIGVRAFTHDIGKSVSPYASVGVEQKLGAFDYNLTLSHDRTRLTYDGAGRRLASDPMLGQGGGDRTRKWNGALRLGYDIDDSRRVEFIYERADLDQDPDYFSDYSTSPVSPDHAHPYSGDSIAENSDYMVLRYTDDAFALGKLSVSLSRNDVAKRFAFTRFDPAVNTLVYYDGNPDDPTAPWNQTELSSLRTNLNISVDSDLSILGRDAGLSWGIEFGHDKTRQKLTDGQDVATPLRNRSTAAFAQLTLPVNDAVTLSGGIRYDRFRLKVGNFTRPRAYYYFPAYGIGLDLAPISVTGGDFSFDQFTGNLGFTANIAPQTQVFGGWSQGYSLTDIGSFTRRAGMNSLAEICTAYGNDNPLIAAAYGCTTPGTYVLSYADIAPEPQVVDTYELGLRHDAGDWNGQVSAFYSTSDDGVSFDPITNRVSQQKERIWGVEAQGAVTLATGTVLDGMIGFREGRYDSDGDGEIDAWLGNNRIVSPLRARLGVTHDLSGWITRAEAIYLGGRDHAQGQLDLPSTTLFNVNLSRDIGQGRLSLAVENLFDRDYVNPTATATRNAETQGWGRTVAVSYRMAF